jgi:hypothetical protein
VDQFDSVILDYFQVLWHRAREVVVSANIKSREQLSRRMAFFLGLAAAASIAAPATVLTATDADAQTRGMERRDERRTDRYERRDARRSKKKKKTKQ